MAVGEAYAAPGKGLRAGPPLLGPFPRNFLQGPCFVGGVHCVIVGLQFQISTLLQIDMEVERGPL